VTTDASGTLPNIPAQNTTTHTDVATTGTAGQAVTYTVASGLSYQQYLNAVSVLQAIAAGGTSVMDNQGGSFGQVITGTAYAQTNTITNVQTTQNGVNSAVMPMADVEYNLRPPGASTSSPVGLEPVGGNNNTPANSPLPRLDTTRFADISGVLGSNNSVQISPTQSIQKISTNPDSTDQMNKFSNMTDPSNPSAPRKMDVSIVSNDSVLFVDHGAGTSYTGSRTLSAPLK